MLNNRIMKEKPSDEEMNTRLKALQKKLAAQTLAVREHKLPVIVLVEGWGTSGKGSLVGRIINNIDPRFYRVASLEKVREEDRRKPFLWRFVKEIPEAGNFVFMDSGWMDQLTREYAHKELSKKDYELRIANVRRFERQLTDNGYLVVKFFLNISKKEQKKRIRTLADDPATKWRVTDTDLAQNKHYDKYMDIFDKFLDATDSSRAPWYIIDGCSKKWAELQVLEILTEGIDVALQNHSLAVPIPQNVFPLMDMPKLSDISLQDKTISDEEYSKRLKELQGKLRELHNSIYHKKIPVIIAYEGWDAAGKGGNIKRVTEALDPRGYEVFPIASPLPYENPDIFSGVSSPGFHAPVM